MKQICINNIWTSYYITETGKCYNSNTNKYLKGQQNKKNGYFSYNLTLPDGNKKRCYAHRLVAEAFIPNPFNKRQVNHIDGNKLNNNVENLEWATEKENAVHAIQSGLRTFKHIYCFNRDKELVAEYPNIEEAANAVGCSTGIICQEINKDVKTLTFGFYWSDHKKLDKVKDYKNLGKAKEVYQYDLKGKFIMKYSSAGCAARAIGASASNHIGECCRGKIKTYKGFIWRYAEDIVSTLHESVREVSETS